MGINQESFNTNFAFKLIPFWFDIKIVRHFIRANNEYRIWIECIDGSGRIIILLCSVGRYNDC